jgi:hypothetical protein
MTDEQQFDLEEVDEELGSPLLTAERALVAGLVIGVLLLVVMTRRRRRRRLADDRSVEF